MTNWTRENPDAASRLIRDLQTENKRLTDALAKCQADFTAVANKVEPVIDKATAIYEENKKLSRDARLFRRLDELLWSKECSQGLVLLPGFSAKGERLVTILDLTDRTMKTLDESGDLGQGSDLRSAIDNVSEKE